MRFLIDTNVFISSEPIRPEQVEESTRVCLELARLSSGEHRLMVHPKAAEEIARDRDATRRQLRDLVLDRYPQLEQPPGIQSELAALSAAQPGSNDWYDDLLLACVLSDAVHGLITQDDGIHRKAKRLGVADRVHTVEDAVAMLRQLEAKPPAYIPSVSFLPLHSLHLQDQFFDSLRADYEGFDDWFRNAARTARYAFVVKGSEGNIAGLAIIKPDDDELRLGGRVMKICTFKVAEQQKGNRYGELLLKSLFRHASATQDRLWITVFPRHRELIDLLESFGFTPHDKRHDEQRLVKHLVPPPGAADQMEALEYHVAFGPPALKITEDQTFIVPIRPAYHWTLFPDMPGDQMSLLPPRPHGNALRKAYLSRANLRTVKPGATLLFYRSRDMMAVTAVGVVEQVLISKDADAILHFVGTRTVYSATEVRDMTMGGEVLALLFRHDRFVEPPIGRNELVNVGVICNAPQAMMSARPEGIPWLRKHLGA